jgi:hypothetical protein
VVEAEAAGEQPVAVGVVDEHPRAHAGHRHRTRHHLAPDVEVAGGVADDRRPPTGAAGGVHAHEPLARHRQQPERVVLAQVLLAGEGQAGDVLERADHAGRLDAGGVQALAQRRGAGQHPLDRRAQAPELQCAQQLARPALDAGHSVRSFAFQLRSRFSTRAGLRWQTACSRQ